MSISSEITRLQTAKSDLKTAINAKGGTLTTETIDDYATAVNAIETATEYKNSAGIFIGGYGRATASTATLAAGNTVTQYYTIYIATGTTAAVADYDLLWLAFISYQIATAPKYVHRAVVEYGKTITFSEAGALQITYELDDTDTAWRLKATIYNPTEASLKYDSTAAVGVGIGGWLEI